jgi:hypothetical protein
VDAVSVASADLICSFEAPDFQVVAYSIHASLALYSPLPTGHSHRPMRMKNIPLPQPESLGKVWETFGKGLGNFWEDTIAIAPMF